MQKLINMGRIQALITLLLFLAVASLPVLGDDVFAVAIGAHDTLVIFGPKGDKVAELTAPAISQPVTVGTTSFQVSYGRDANDLLTAILTPSATQPQALHFNVLSKSIETDRQAVVTLTFTAGQQHVIVDPGYVGLVRVNSHTVRHHDINDEQYASMPPQPAYRLNPAGSALAHPAPAPALVPREARLTKLTSDEPAPPKLVPASPDSSPSASSDASASPPPSGPLSWPGSVTPPNGVAPHVASNQMMLVQVKGDVTVQSPDGHTTAGTDGMIVPNGDTVTTADNSTAAVFMGGVNSARLTPQSEATVTQHVNGSVRKTMINLEKGTVFSRVGRRIGESQDYKVETPQGVAAAHGTEFAVTTTSDGKTTICSVVDGVVEFTDPTTGDMITVTPSAPGQVSIASSPVMSLAAAQAILSNILSVIGQIAPTSNQTVTTFLDSVTQAVSTALSNGTGNGSNTATPPPITTTEGSSPAAPGTLSTDAGNTSTF